MKAANEDDFNAYAIGVVVASICTSLPIEDAIERMNRENPTGLDSKWQLCADKTFKTGETNPCPCNTKPETHKHYLLCCWPRPA